MITRKSGLAPAGRVRGPWWLKPWRAAACNLVLVTVAAAQTPPPARVCLRIDLTAGAAVLLAGREYGLEKLAADSSLLASFLDVPATSYKVHPLWQEEPAQLAVIIADYAGEYDVSVTGIVADGCLRAVAGRQLGVPLDRFRDTTARRNWNQAVAAPFGRAVLDDSSRAAAAALLYLSFATGYPYSLQPREATTRQRRRVSPGSSDPLPVTDVSITEERGRWKLAGTLAKAYPFTILIDIHGVVDADTILSARNP